MQKGPHFTVSLSEAEVSHLNILTDHKAKSGYEDGLRGAHLSLSILDKVQRAVNAVGAAGVEDAAGARDIEAVPPCVSRN